MRNIVQINKDIEPRVAIDIGLAHLRNALEYFKAAQSPKTAERVRLAISSAKGAARAQRGRDIGAKYEPERKRQRLYRKVRPKLAVVTPKQVGYARGLVEQVIREREGKA